MLQNIHDKAKGWIAYAIVIFISIPFALFGISSYLGGSDSLVAANVNGEEIPAQTVQNAVLQQRQRLSQMFGGKLPPGFSDATLKTQALDQSVNELLLRQLAKENGYRASNQEIFDTISEIPAFQKNGKFDVKTYELLLTSQRRNKAGFEAEIRDSISTQQFSGAITDTAFVTAEEASRYKRLQDQKRNIETYTLKIDDYKSDIKIEEPEIKTYYDSKPDQFLTAEKVKVNYVILDEAELQKKVQVDDEKLHAFYDENTDRYKTPEQRKVSHILIKIDEGEDAEKKAMEKAKSLYDQIKSGEKTFEELASSESDDKVAAKKSGDLGLIAKGDMSPGFEKVAFSLKATEVSQPTKTETGIEIIKVNSVLESRQKTFAEVKSEIDTRYRKEEAEKLFVDHSDKLQTLAFENDGSLDEAADSVGVKVLGSGWITRSAAPAKKQDADKKGHDLENSPKVIAAAFSEDVLKSGKNSELLEIEQGVVAIVRLQEHQPSDRKPMSDVIEEIKAKLVEQKARKMVIEKGESLLAELHKSGWSALGSVGASEDNLVKKMELTRNEREVSPQVVDETFSMTKPANEKPSFANTILPNGDYVLIGLSSVVDGKAEVDEVERNRYYANLGSRERTAALKALRERAEVTLFPENIQ